MLIDIFGSLEPSLKGKIKTLTEFVNAEPYIKYYYDVDGFEVERVFYKNRQIDYLFKLHTDAVGYYVTDQNVQNGESKTILKFDKNRNLLYHQGRLIEYDENQKSIKESLYYPNGNLEEAVNYRYVNSCKEMETICYNTQGEIWERTVIKYNKNGNIEILETYGADRLQTTERYTYDEKGNEIRIDKINNYDDCLLDENIFEYDENGYLKFSSHYDNKHNIGGASYYHYELDNYNRILTKIATDEDGELQEQQIYEYDEVGNIIKEIETQYYSEEKTTVKAFVIEYY